MNSATEELLKEYDEWARRQSFAAPKNTPADFMQERRIARITKGVSQHLQDEHGDRYPLEEYLEVEDIDWLKSQGSTEVTVV